MISRIIVLVNWILRMDISDIRIGYSDIQISVIGEGVNSVINDLFRTNV